MESDAKEKFLAAYNAYADALFRHCYLRIYDRKLAKDLVQETFCRTWTFLAEGKEIQNFRAFLYRVIHNLIVDEIRRTKLASLDQLIEQGFTPEDDSVPDPKQQFSTKEIMQKINQLEESYRDIILLRFIEDLSPKEIAAVLAVSENVISVRIHRGIKKLQQLLEHE